MSGVTRIALAGCGAVGGALAGLLVRDPARWRLEGGLVRDLEKDRPHLARVDLTDDPARFASLPADVLVEAMGGIEPARTLVVSALSRGASVVTANKALIAAHGPELRALAEREGAMLAFDAAVGGGIPAVRTLETTFRGLEVRSLRGILNGTANFLLSRIEGGSTYAAALDEARSAGIAEADPRRDVDGRDAADKIRILAWLAWGIPPTEIEVECSGIVPDPEGLVAAAAGRGCRARLVAHAERADRRAVVARVEVVEVTPDSPEGRTRGVDNLLRIGTGDCGVYRLSGPGAGGLATAAAVLSDLHAVSAGGGRRGVGT